MLKQYVCRINSTEGLRGSVIERQHDEEVTRDLLARGIICEVKVMKPAEAKEAPAKRTRAKK